MSALIELYGYYEMNECTSSLIRLEVNKDDVYGGDDETGEVFVRYPQHGRWFKTFSHAKASAVKELTGQVRALQWALKRARKMKKEDV